MTETGLKAPHGGQGMGPLAMVAVWGGVSLAAGTAQRKPGPPQPPGKKPPEEGEWQRAPRTRPEALGSRGLKSRLRGGRTSLGGAWALDRSPAGAPTPSACGYWLRSGNVSLPGCSYPQEVSEGGQGWLPQEGWLDLLTCVWAEKL